MNRLGSSTSPYLLLHADNPVDWWPWSAEAFAEAKRRDVPVMVSIGYATCHWCHVMARESFSDPLTAARINERFVAIKVDREEHPDVDASYLAAAGAFTRQLGWPLTVFTTPDGLAFFAGTYFPPTPVGGMASFTQVLDAVTEAWSERRDQVTGQAAAIGEALTAAASRERPDDALPGVAELDAAAVALAGHEDTEFGGFGTAPKFPVAPVLGFLLAGDADARALAARTLERMGASALRDSVEGGFFRYATRRDWTDPHYERMLYDNALLLDDYVRAGLQTPSLWSRVVSEAVAGFLIEVMQLPDGGFASAQDSESTIGGDRSEGGYYRLDAEARSRETPPALDRKVLSGWNGLAVGALAGAGAAFDRPEWIAAAARAADRLLATHVRGDRLVRSSLDGRVSPAKATLEDFGMLAGGLAALATASGEVRFAVAARTLVEMTMEAGAGAGTAAGLPFAVPGGADDVLVAQGVALGVDASEGAYPSGWTATADAAHRLFLLTGDRRMLAAAEGAMRSIAVEALANPIAYGGALALMRRLADPVTQLVVVVPDAAGSDDSDELPAAARARPSSVTAIVTEEQARTFAEAGFELFEGRVSLGGEATAYLCTDFVCRLPVTSAAAL